MYVSPTEEDSFATGIWQVKFRGDHIGSANGQIDGWSFTYNGNYFTSASGGNTSKTLNELASGNQTIAAAGFYGGELNSSGAIYSGSGRGPTRDGRQKPDIAGNQRVYVPHYSNDSTYYATGSGTSYSSPHVGGAVALMFQQNSCATPSQIKNSLYNSAFTDEYTDNAGPEPNYQVGYGKLNSYTGTNPQSGDLVINEVDTDSSRGTFVELYNNTSETLDLSNVSLLHYDGSTPANLTANLSGHLAPDSFYVIAKDSADFVSTYGISADQYESSLYLNDGDEWLELDNGAKAVIDHFSANGQSWTTGHVYERTGYPNDGTSISSHWTDTGTGLGSPNGQNDNPLPVELTSFTAQFQNNKLTLYWTTQTETDNLGWNIYRGEYEIAHQDGMVVKINPEIIPGAGTTSQPTDYTYRDEYEVPVMPDSTYWYWLEDIDYSGTTEVHDPISITIPNIRNEDYIPEIPETYGLFQNHPNPFNPATEIAFRLKSDSNVEVNIYNIKGEFVKSLFAGNVKSDELRRVIWDGKDESGKEVGSGIYLYRLKTDKDIQIRKMVLLR